MGRYRITRSKVDLYASKSFLSSTLIVMAIIFFIGGIGLYSFSFSATNQLETIFDYWGKFTSTVKDSYNQKGFDPRHSSGSNPSAYLTLAEINTLGYLIRSSFWLTLNSLSVLGLVHESLTRIRHLGDTSAHQSLLTRLKNSMVRSVGTYFLVGFFNQIFTIYYLYQLMSWALQLTPNDFYRDAAFGFFAVHLFWYAYFLFWFGVAVYQRYSQ